MDYMNKIKELINKATLEELKELLLYITLRECEIEREKLECNRDN